MVVLLTYFIPAKTITARFYLIPDEMGGVGDRSLYYPRQCASFYEHPILPAGEDAFMSAIGQKLGLPLGPHSNLLSVGVNAGLIGLAAFLLAGSPICSLRSRWFADNPIATSPLLRFGCICWNCWISGAGAVHNELRMVLDVGHSCNPTLLHPRRPQRVRKKLRRTRTQSRSHLNMSFPWSSQRSSRLDNKIRRLCYVSGQPAARDVESWYLSNYSFRIVCYPTAYFPDVTLVAPLAPAGTLREGSNRVAVSKLENMKVRVLPSPNLRPLRWLRQWPVLWDCIGKADLVCANIPDESGFLAAVICKLKKKPLLVQVLGDWRIATLFAGRPGIIRTIKSWFGEWMTRVTVRSANLVFTQGQTLFDKCASLNPDATQSALVHSTVTEEAFFERNAASFHEAPPNPDSVQVRTGKGTRRVGKIASRLAQSGIAAGMVVRWTGAF